MRILTVHADFIEVEPLERAINEAEEISKEKKLYREVLVAFIAVEKGDEDIEKIANKAKEEIEKIVSQIGVESIVLYPLVHLTSNPSSPQIALNVIKKIEELLKEKYKIFRAPFGWYKAYTLKCKGHPLSELSREIKLENKSEEHISLSLKTEEKLKTYFYILTPEGKIFEVDKFDFSGFENLKKFALYEIKKIRSYEKEPAHIKLMQNHRLAWYESGSDQGNFRWYPKGKLLKKLLSRAVSELCISFGAQEVETPIMYDFGHVALKKYLDRFPSRQYVVLSEDKKLFLRFSACFGQFLIASNGNLTYRQLPLRFYELALSFRREQAGELTGLKRLRSFTMPDMHTFVKNIEEAKKEFGFQLEKCIEWNKSIGLNNLEVAFRAEKSFFENNKEWYISLIKKIGKPVLLEIFEKRYAYFITKFEFNFIDSMDKASALSTVQIDVENAETFDISYVDADNTKKRPIILHASLSGSIERVIYAILENEAMKIERGEKGNFPLWLAPSQVRIIPVSNKFLDYAQKLLYMAKDRRVRVDLDDTEDSLAKKIRRAEMEWCPYIVVVGEKELEKNTVSVKIRETSSIKEMDFAELLKEIEEKTADKPFEKISFGNKVSEQINF